MRPAAVIRRRRERTGPEGAKQLIAPGGSPGKVTLGAKRRIFVIALVLTLPASAGDIPIRVLELFHPTAVTLAAPQGRRTTVETPKGRLWLEGAQAFETALRDGRVTADGPVEVRIGAQLVRTYPGKLAIEPAEGELRLLVTLSLEQAVAAIVAAEAGPGAPEEVRKAQAIATRSFLLAAKGRHQGYDFCDTTHCHHLTEADDASWTAAEATRGLTLTHAGRVVEALSTRRCGGTTRSLADIGFAAGGYAFFPVVCEACRRRPSPWTRQWPISAIQALIAKPGNEMARLEVVRKLGWSAVPSNVYTLNKMGDNATIEGQGEGHGVGLCQFGAAELARQGWSAARILAHYFPNTTIGK